MILRRPLFLSRPFFSWLFPRSTGSLIEAANSAPHDSRLQADLMHRLLYRDPLEAIRRYESGLFAINDDTTELYCRALYKTGQFDRLVRFIPNKQRGDSSNDASEDTPSSNNNNSNKESLRPILGTKESPLIVENLSDGKRNNWRALGGLVNFLLTAGILWVLYKSSSGRLEDLFGRGTVHKIYQRPGDPNKKNKNGAEEDKPTKFSDVRGCDEAKAELEEAVEFLKNPQKFNKLGARLPKGVLLIGPPGTGKTLLARAVAGEANVPFIYASGAEFDELFVGLGSMRIRQMFAEAKERAPAIVFIDEIDAIGSKRNPRDPQHARMSLNQLLVELDGFSSTDGIVVIAATNFPETLDKALLRPGRFDRHVIVPLPDVAGRRDILELFLQNCKLSKDVDTDVIARGTPGFSGADLNKLVNQAKIAASRESAPALGSVHLEAAKDDMLMGSERRSLVVTYDDRRLAAYHESGHAIVALRTAGSMPLHKATIVPRGKSLGQVAQLPERDHLNLTRQQLLARLDVAMGGRAAEELVFGADAVTTGASSDFDAATLIARSMVLRYGMGESLGTMTVAGEEELDALSPASKSAVDAEIRKILEEARMRAVSILSASRPALDRLAKALLERETLTKEQITAIVN